MAHPSSEHSASAQRRLRSPGLSGADDTRPRSNIYAPLDHSRRMIRLIEILPSDTSSDPVACRLETVNLTDETRYAALSYVWGDPHVTEDILVNGFTLPVTTNLASALRNFRQHGFPQNEETGYIQYLWADAICIDQSEGAAAVSEKNRQVAQMGEIYKTASSVLSWLGPPDSKRIDRALQIIHDYMSYVRTLKTESNRVPIRESLPWLKSVLGSHYADGAELAFYGTEWEPLEALQAHTYWERVWIFQEMVLAKPDAVHFFICGNVSITYPELQEFNALFTDFDDEQLSVLGEDDVSSRQVRAPELPVLELPILELLTIPQLAFVSMLRRHLYKQEYQSAAELSEVFAHALEISSHRRATRPHDYVYALLGIFPRAGIEPDYTLSVRNVYVDAILRSSSEYLSWVTSFWGCGCYETNEYDLPSWLPDLTKLHDLGPIPLIQTPAPLVSELSFCVKGDGRVILTTKGIAYSKVTKVHRIQFSPDAGNLSNIGIEWFRISTDYLVDLVGVSNTSQPSRLRPLKELVSVISWTEVSAHEGAAYPEHSELCVDAYRLTRGAIQTMSNEELDNRADKLGLADATSLAGFLYTCYFDSQNLPKEQECGPREWTWKFVKNIMLRADGRTIFTTDHGHTGIGPPHVQPGDLVIDDGATAPQRLLRKLPSLDEEDLFEQVGACYVHGLYDRGEFERKGESEPRVFKIV